MIRKLPPEAISKLLSGVAIKDAVQCVLELVYNSLDAEATAIAARIDIKNYQIQVIDNGKGISKQDLELIGERFMTSKYNSSGCLDSSTFTYGFKGQTIASLLDVCRLLIIETQPENGASSFVKIFIKSKSKPHIEVQPKKTGSGTIVTIEDFMFNMPVRRRKINEVFDIEEVKNQIQYLAIFHYNVSFTLRNENKDLILLQTHQTKSTLQSISNLFGTNIANSLKPFSHEEEKCFVSGLISSRLQNQNNLQLVYVNKRLLSKGVIHKFVNDVMKKYIDINSEPSKHEVITLGNNKTSQHLIYIIHIKCSHSDYDLLANFVTFTVEFRDWEFILKCIYKGLKKGLKLNYHCLESSLNSSDTSENVLGGESKKAVSTSLLVNAVKGAPAKRKINSKGELKKKKKKKLSIKSDKNTVLERNNNMPIASKPMGKKFEKNSMTKHLNYTSDSLESPIPKNHLKSSNLKKISVCSKPAELKTIKSLSHSFLEFYDWLKSKLETNADVLTLYKDFLLHTQRKETSKGSDFKKPKSPVLDKKSKKSEYGGQEKVSVNYSVVISSSVSDAKTKENKVVFPDGMCLNKNSGYFLFRNEKQQNLSQDLPYHEILNLSPRKTELWKFGGGTDRLKINSTNSYEHRKYAKVCKAVSPPNSIELAFKNFIEFRNVPESFEQKSQENQLYSTIPNTWMSHYNNHTLDYLTVKQSTEEKNDYFPVLETFNENHFSRDNIFFWKYSSFNKQNMNIGLNKSKTDKVGFSELNVKPHTECQDAEVQTRISESVVHTEKIDAMVQTGIHNGGSDSIKVPDSNITNTFAKSLSFEFAPNFESIGRSSAHNFGINFRELQENTKQDKILSQEPPYPDFWNVSEPEDSEQIKNSFPSGVKEASLASRIKEVSENSTKSLVTNVNGPENKSSSSEIMCCAQKSVSTSRQQKNSFSSKETETVAAIWTDSLMNIGNSAENSNSESLIDSGNPNIESDLPATIPLDKLGLNIPEHPETLFSLSERHDFVPKGLSPKFLSVSTKTTETFTLCSQEKDKIKITVGGFDNRELETVKWQDESTGGSTKPTILDRILDEMQQKAIKNMSVREGDILSASLSYCAVRVHDLLHSFVFTKDLLSNVMILGQLDKKFIVAKITVSVPKKMELISLFDQHAVDERIKLEELMNEYVTSDGDLISTSLNPSINFTLSESDVQLLLNLDDKLSKMGIIIKALDNNTIIVEAVPVYLIHKHDKNVKNKKDVSLRDIIETLIKDILVEIAENRGTILKVTRFIHNSFCSEACHSAIKFNKMLTTENMIELINKLKTCKLPFQCAHGRPSVIPIIDLEDFNSLVEEQQNINLEKLKKFISESRCQGDVENSKG